MDDLSPFWQMLWANFIWFVSTGVLITVPLLLIGRYKLKKMKAKQIEQMEKNKKNDPRVIAFGVPKAEKGHCPLCGQGWPLEGPLYRENEDGPESHK